MFWKKTKYKENKDYSFVEIQNVPITGIKLLKGKYKGVIYHYLQAKIVDQPEIDCAKLQFGYNIIDSGHHDKSLLQNDSEFVNMMGDILSELLLNKTESYEQTRTIDLEEPDL